MAYKLTKQVSLLSEPTTTTGTAYASPQQALPWLYTSANYDGTIAVYLEVDWFISNVSYTASAQLLEVGGSAVAGSEVTTQAGTAVANTVRSRSGDIFGNLGDGHDYIVQIKTSNAAGTVNLRNARLIIQQSGSVTKTETIIELMGPLFTSAGTSYADMTSSVAAGTYTHADADFDGTVDVRFEAVGRVANATRTCTIGLHDSANSLVSTAECAFSSTSYNVRTRYAGAVTLVNATAYKARFKTSVTTASSGTVFCARLVIAQTGAWTRTQCQFPIHKLASTSTATAHASTKQPSLLTLADFNTDATTYYFESIGKIANATATNSVELCKDDGTVIDTRTHTATLNSKSRGGSLDLSTYDGATLETWIKTSATTRTATLYMSKLIVICSKSEPVTDLSINVSESVTVAEVITNKVSGYVVLFLSDNIAANAATDTTYQLSTPSTKTTADFQASKISDDTNPITTDLASGKYTEPEWSLKLATGLSNGDEIKFRITDSGADTLTLTVVPTITIGAADAGLTLSVSDSVSVSETVTGVTGTLVRSLTETFTVSEVTTAIVSSPNRSLSDSLTVGESVTTVFIWPPTLLLSVNDSVGIAEVVTGLGGTLVRSLTDSVTVTETTTAVGGALVANTSDTFSVSEVVTGKGGTLVGSTSDSLSVSEVTTSLVGSLVGTTSDTYTVSEQVTVSTSAQIISVNDSVGVSEVSTVALGAGATLTISKDDSVGVSESVSSLVGTLIGSVSDSAGVTELVSSLTGSLVLVVTDSLTVSDLDLITCRVGSPVVSTSDSLTVNEVSTVYCIGPTLVVNLTDSYGVTEQVSCLTGSLVLSTSDSLTVNELVSTIVSSLILSTTDSVTLSETSTCNVNVAESGPTLLISISDSYTITEQVSSLTSSCIVSVSDSLVVSELSNLSMIREVSIIDTLLVGEEVDVKNVLAGVEASETVLVQELVGCSLGPLELNVEETSSLAESTISVVSAPVINVSESILVLEEITVVRIVSGEFNIQDSVSVEDSIGIKVSDLPSSSFETVTLDEQTSVEIRLQVEAVEVITVSSEIKTSTSALMISVSESTLVDGVVSCVTGDAVINITDNVLVGEVVSTGSTLADLVVDVSSDVGVDEVSGIEFVFAVSVVEQVVVGEGVSCWTGDLSLTVSDSVVISEQVSIYWQIASGLLILDCDILVPLFDCELLYPELETGVLAPELDTELLQPEVNVYMQLPTIDLEVA